MEITNYIFLIFVSAVVGNPCLNQTLSTMPYPYNCNTFVVCWMSKPYFQACPIGSLFDTIKHNCQPWSIAMCCNSTYPKLPRVLPPLPTSQPGSSIVNRKTLPPIPENFITKLTPEDVTKSPVQQATTQKEIFTKSTTLTTTESPEKSSDTSKDIFVTSKTLLTSTLSSASDTPKTPLLNTTLLTSTQGTSSKHISETIVTESITESLPNLPITSTKTSVLTTLITRRTDPNLSEQTMIEKKSTVTSRKPDKPTTPSKTPSVINLTTIVTEPRTVTETLHIIEADEKQTLSPIYNSKTPVPLTSTPKVASSSDTNLIVTDKHTVTRTLDTVDTSEKQTSSPIIPTIETNGDTVVTKVAPIQSPTFKVSTSSDINLLIIERHPVTGTLDIVDTSQKQTLSPIRPTSETKGATVETSDTPVQSTNSKVSSSSDTNFTVTEPHTVIGTLETVDTSEKQTLLPISPTIETNGDTVVTWNTPIQSTTSIVSSSDINLIVTKRHPVTGTLYIVDTSEKQTLSPIRPTSETKGATVETSDTPVQSTTSKVSSSSDTNFTVTESHTVIGTLETVDTSEKQTLLPISPTIETNGDTVVTWNTPIQSTTSIVSGSDINLIVTERHPVTGTLDTVDTSEKQTSSPIIPTIETNGDTVATKVAPIQSPTFKVSTSSDINSLVTERHPVTGTLDIVDTSQKQTLSPISPTSEIKEATVRASDTPVQSTTSKVSSSLDINFTVTEPHTVIGALNTVETSKKQTLSPITPTIETNGVTVVTRVAPAQSPTSRVSTSSDINSLVTERHPVTGTLDTVDTSEKQTSSPIIPTIETNGDTVATKVAPIQSPTFKVSTSSDINSLVTERHPVTGTLDAVNTSEKQTSSPIIPTIETNGDTVVTKVAPVQSPTSKVSTSSHINSLVTERHPVTGTLDIVDTSQKQTLSPISPTSEIKEATVRASDTPVQSTTSKVSSSLDINFTVTEPHTVIGALNTVETSKKQTLSPITPTIETNGVTVVTRVAPAQSPTSRVSTSSDINSLVTERHPVSGTLDTVDTSEKQTSSPIIPTIETNGDTVATKVAPIQSPTFKVSTSSDINSLVTERHPVTGTLDAVNTSEKQTSSPIIPTIETDGDTVVTKVAPIQSPTFKVSTSSDINSLIIERHPVTGTLDIVDPSEKQTLTPIRPTSETKGATVETSDTPVQSTNSKVSSSSDTNFTVTEPHTVIGTLETVDTSEKQTLLPISPTIETNGDTVVTWNTPIQSTTSIVSSSDINLIVTKRHTVTGTIDTVDSSDKQTLPSIIPTSKTTKATFVTTETSNESTTPVITVSTESKKTTKLYTSATERNSTPTDFNLPTRVSNLTSSNAEITQQTERTLYTGQTLRPISTTSNRACPFTPSPTSETPIEPQLPECRINDNFVYPDLVNCNFYYRCSNGIMERLNCRPKLGFNPHLMKCIPEERAKCGLYKSAADQRTFLISFLLFNHMKKNTQFELNEDKINSIL